MIALYQPKPDDLWFRQEMLSDESTMTYNHAWGGAIPFSKERWASWYAKWLGGNPNFFYRYLRDDGGAFVGEAAYHYEDARQVFLCDVIVYAKYRGELRGVEPSQPLGGPFARFSPCPPCLASARRCHPHRKSNKIPRRGVRSSFPGAAGCQGKKNAAGNIR